MRYQLWNIGKLPRNIVVVITDCRNNGLRIYADHKRAWNKLSHCPVQLPLPVTEEQEVFLKQKLKWLSTNAGFKASNTFVFNKWVDEYPRSELCL